MRGGNSGALHSNLDTYSQIFNADELQSLKPARSASLSGFQLASHVRHSVPMLERLHDRNDCCFAMSVSCLFLCTLNPPFPQTNMGRSQTHKSIANYFPAKPCERPRRQIAREDLPQKPRMRNSAQWPRRGPPGKPENDAERPSVKGALRRGIARRDCPRESPERNPFGRERGLAEKDCAKKCHSPGTIFYARKTFGTLVAAHRFEGLIFVYTVLVTKRTTQ